MKKAFEILWAAAAEMDLLETIEYIADDNSGAALKVLSRIKASTARLDYSPKRGRIVPQLKKYGMSRYREIVIKSLRVFYRIQDNKVYIVSVIDGRRNVEDILFEKLLR